MTPTKKRPVGRPKKAKAERKTFLRFGVITKHAAAAEKEIKELLKKYE